MIPPSISSRAPSDPSPPDANAGRPLSYPSSSSSHRRYSPSPRHAGHGATPPYEYGPSRLASLPRAHQAKDSSTISAEKNSAPRFSPPSSEGSDYEIDFGDDSFTLPPLPPVASDSSQRRSPSSPPTREDGGREVAFDDDLLTLTPPPPQIGSVPTSTPGSTSASSIPGPNGSTPTSFSVQHQEPLFSREEDAYIGDIRDFGTLRLLGTVRKRRSSHNHDDDGDLGTGHKRRRASRADRDRSPPSRSIREACSEACHSGDPPSSIRRDSGVCFGDSVGDRGEREISVPTPKATDEALHLLRQRALLSRPKHNQLQKQVPTRPGSVLRAQGLFGDGNAPGRTGYVGGGSDSSPRRFPFEDSLALNSDVNKHRRKSHDEVNADARLRHSDQSMGGLTSSARLASSPYPRKEIDRPWTADRSWGEPHVPNSHPSPHYRPSRV